MDGSPHRSTPTMGCPAFRKDVAKSTVSIACSIVFRRSIERMRVVCRRDVGDLLEVLMTERMVLRYVCLVRPVAGKARGVVRSSR